MELVMIDIVVTDGEVEINQVELVNVLLFFIVDHQQTCVAVLSSFLFTELPLGRFSI